MPSVQYGLSSDFVIRPSLSLAGFLEQLGFLQMPVTLNGGMLMNSWYDIYSIDKIDAKQDIEGLTESAR